MTEPVKELELQSIGSSRDIDSQLIEREMEIELSLLVSKSFSLVSYKSRRLCFQC